MICDNQKKSNQAAEKNNLKSGHKLSGDFWQNNIWSDITPQTTKLCFVGVLLNFLYAWYTSSEFIDLLFLFVLDKNGDIQWIAELDNRHKIRYAARHCVKLYTNASQERVQLWMNAHTNQFYLYYP